MAPLAIIITAFEGNKGCRDANRETYNPVLVAGDIVTHEDALLRHRIQFTYWDSLVVVVVVVLTLTRTIKSVVTGQAPVTGAQECPWQKHTNQRWYTHISHLTHFMSPPEAYKKCTRESAYDVPSPYWCIRLTTRAWKHRLHKYRLFEISCQVYQVKCTWHQVPTVLGYEAQALSKTDCELQARRS